MKKIFKNNFLLTSTFTFLILFIILLSFYPAIVCFDGDNQWQQVQSGIITNAHPFFSTFFMFLLSKIWNSITSLASFQIVLVSISWGYFCKVIKTNDLKKQIIVYLFTTIMLLIPLVSLYSITIWKDTLYTSYLFLSGVFIYDWSQNNYKITKVKSCILGFLLAMVFSYRHNGMIVSLILVFLVLFICIKKYRKKQVDKTNLKNIFLVFLSFVAVLIIISIPKNMILKESDKKLKKDNKSEISCSTIDSYMLWMMGAHIKENNIKDDDDLEFLNNIIPIEEWKSVYNPYLINSTNLAENLDKQYLVDNSSKFEKIFVTYTKKYPNTIFEHYIKADSLLINPLASFSSYVYVYSYPVMESLPNYTVIKSKIPIVKKFYDKAIEYSFKKPFIMFYQPALIMYLSLIIAVILALRVYGKKVWLFCSPMIANTISLFPINLAQDLRYVYINYFVFFGLSLMLILNFRDIIKKKK